MNATHDKLYDYVDGELTPDERSAFESHLKTCDMCRNELHALEDLQGRLASLPGEIQPKHDLWKEIEPNIESQLQPLASGLEKRRNGQQSESQQHRLSGGLQLTWYLRAAAVVLILVGAGIISFLLLKPPAAPVDSSSTTATSPLPQTTPTPRPDVQAKGTVPESHSQSPAEELALNQAARRNESAGTQLKGQRSGANDSLVAMKRIEGEVRLPLTSLTASRLGKIVGTISDEHGQPIAGATVQLAGLDRSVFSNAGGEFVLFNVPTGTYTLKAHGSGYREIDIPGVKIISGFTALVNFQLGSGTVTINDLLKNDDTRVSRFAAKSPNPLAGARDITLSQSEKRVDHAVPGQGNTGKIGGRIVDAQGQPVVGATVLVEGTQRGAATDPAGQYMILAVPIGTYSVKAVSVGYQTKVAANVRVAADSLTSLDFMMANDAIALQVVTITGEQPLVNHLTTSSTQTISSNVAAGIPVAKSVEDALKLQAGAVRRGNNLYLKGGRVEALRYDGFDADYGRVPPSPPPPNTEQYDNINENEYLDPFENPLSTFSIDVDNASYSNVRRFINAGQVPPKDAVRIEELVNYFSYDYPQPNGREPFSITTELAACPWNSSNKLLLVGLQGKKIASENIPPSNLVFLIDVSGSMNEPNKLPLVKSAFRLLVDQLREQDRVSIVTYAGNAGLVLPSTRGDQKGRILSAIEQLEAGGSTAGGAGLMLAYNVARENFTKEGNNRVILATDGDFNVGVSSDDGLVKLIEERRDQGIYLSVVGFGMGNYKDSKMEKLADKGNGNYAYIDNLQEARRVFVSQMAGTLFTIAKDVKIQIEFNPVNVKAYRLIGYENRMLAREDFNDDRKDAGELGSGHSVTALYEIVPADGGREYSKVDRLKYQADHQQTTGRHVDEILTIKLRYKPPTENESKLIAQIVPNDRQTAETASDNLKFAASVAEFGMLLRDSKFKASSNFDQVIRLAQNAKGPDADGYRAEFIRLVEACAVLVK